MEKLVIFNFFRDIIPRDLGGYLQRRRTTEIYDNGSWIMDNG
jgi:hypothetical protein